MPTRRTSKVTFRNSSPERTIRRKSKTKSPRSKIIKHVTKSFKRISPQKFKNKYARDLGEFVQVISPFVIGALSVALYLKSKDQ